MEKNRLFRKRGHEGNFNIFHQMFAGMTNSELREFHLSGYSVQDLKWMPCKHGGDDQNKMENKTDFKAVTINENDYLITDCETKDCENEDSSVSEPEDYYYYYYDYIDSDKANENKDESYEPLAHHL